MGDEEKVTCEDGACPVEEPKASDPAPQVKEATPQTEDQILLAIFNARVAQVLTAVNDLYRDVRGFVAQVQAPKE